MENQKTSSKIHPLVAGAAVSVMVLSLAGVAAITGLLPNSNSSTAPVAVLASSAPTPAADKITTLAPTTEVKQFAATTKTKSAVPAQSQPKHKPEQKSVPSYSENAYTPPVQAASCGNCGTIESVHAIQQAAQPNGIGAVAGALLGGILGNQVGGGNGKKLATVAGAVGGGFAGNEVEKRTRTTSSYEIRVRMEDGSMRNFADSGQSGWQSGDRVRVVNGSLTSQG
ncbi:MAG: glycine zipper 2TM domain-containing protein [Oxalobacteraceae bacterium]|nr:glycine zipper 2TM domain-containing protein [Oxalobacteraceae bacterium]